MSGAASKTERVLEIAKSLVGHACWSAMASQRTDWVVVLDLGEKRRRTMRLANPRLSFLQRTFEGEYSVLIECVWRLDGKGGVVTSCFDANEPGGPMRKGLAELEGRKIADVHVANAALDLEIVFEDGYVLRCLSTEVDRRHKRNNWSLWSPQGLVTVGPAGSLLLESSEEAERRQSALKRSLAQEEEEIVSRFPRERPKETAPEDEDPSDS